MDFSRRICRGVCNQISGLCMGICLTDDNFARNVYHQHKENVIRTKGVDAWVVIPEFEAPLKPQEPVPEASRPARSTVR